jgi:hypothetical protein
MTNLPSEQVYYRPCCVLLKEKSRSMQSLSDSATCTELLDCMERYCVLMKMVGQGRVKLDQQSGQCYLLLDPTSVRQILNEINETITLEGLTDYYEILNKIESSIAKSPLLKEITDHHTELLAAIRGKESRFGAVPVTVDKSVIRSPELLDRQKFLLDHPRFENSPQFDGVPPSQTAIPNDNSNAAEQVNRLQNQHQPKPAFNPRPQI